MQAENQSQQNNHQKPKQPLKDTTNTVPKSKQDKEDEQSNNQEPESTQSDTASSSSNNNNHQQGSLQCLETLAQKAGIHDITADDCKYDVANTLLNLDRGHDFIKHELKQDYLTNNMSDIKNQQQQVGTFELTFLNI